MANPSELQNKRIALASREKPSFAAVTPGKAGFGAIGAAAMISSGNGIVRDNNVDDPADWIAKELADSFQQKRGVKVVGKVSIKDEKPATIVKSASNADYVLDVRTINWSFVYFPVNWGTYRVIYSSKLRLIDCKTGKIVAEGFYARVPEKTDQSPSYDQLTENKAAGLKKELRIGAQESLSHFKTNILKP